MKADLKDYIYTKKNDSALDAEYEQAASCGKV